VIKDLLYHFIGYFEGMEFLGVAEMRFALANRVGRFPPIPSLFITCGARTARSSRLELEENHSGIPTK